MALRSGYIDNDVFKVEEEILLDIGFQTNQANIDYSYTNKKRLDETIDKIVRTLKNDKHASLELSGGTNIQDLSKGVDNEANPYTYAQLVRDRVETVKKYIEQFTRKKSVLRRIYDNGKVIRNRGAMVRDQIVH